MRTIYNCMILGLVLLVLSCTNQSLETSFNTQDTKITEYAESVRFVECVLNTQVDDNGNASITRTAIDTIAPIITRQDGAVRMTIVQGTGEGLSPKGSAKIYFAGYIFNSGPASMDFAEGNFNGAYGILFSYPSTTFPTSSSTASGSSSGLTMFATNHEATALYVQWNVTDGIYDALEVSPSDKNLVEGLRAGLVGVKAGEVCEIAFSGKYGFGKKGLGIVPANAALLYRVWVESVSN